MVTMSITSSSLNGLVNFLLPAVGICFVIFLIFEAVQYFKGQIAMKKLFIGLFAFVLIGGALVFAKVYFQNTSSSEGAKSVVNKATTQVTSDTGNVIGGN